MKFSPIDKSKYPGKYIVDGRAWGFHDWLVYEFLMLGNPHDEFFDEFTINSSGNEVFIFDSKEKYDYAKHVYNVKTKKQNTINLILDIKVSKDIAETCTISVQTSEQGEYYFSLYSRIQGELFGSKDLNKVIRYINMKGFW